jgi:hypothetical protein
MQDRRSQSILSTNVLRPRNVHAWPPLRAHPDHGINSRSRCTRRTILANVPKQSRWPVGHLSIRAGSLSRQTSSAIAIFTRKRRSHRTNLRLSDRVAVEIVDGDVLGLCRRRNCGAECDEERSRCPDPPGGHARKWKGRTGRRGVDPGGLTSERPVAYINRKDHTKSVARLLQDCLTVVSGRP